MSRLGDMEDEAEREWSFWGAPPRPMICADSMLHEYVERGKAESKILQNKSKICIIDLCVCELDMGFDVGCGGFECGSSPP